MLELDQQRGELRLADLVQERQVGRHDGGAEPGEGGGRVGHHLGHRRHVLHSGAGQPESDPLAAQGVRAEPGQVVHVQERRGRGGRRVRRVDAAQHGQSQRRVHHVLAHRAGGVLLGRDRHDAGPADQAERRLDPDHAVLTGRADDGAVGLGADRHRGEVRRDGHGRAGATSRTGCGRARTGCSSGRRPRSTRSTRRWSGSWPTRTGSPCRAPPRRPRAARCTRNASRAGVESDRARTSRPWCAPGRRVSTLSLSRIGIPSSGERAPECRRCLSLADAIRSASGLVCDHGVQLRVERGDPAQVEGGQLDRGQLVPVHRPLQVGDGRRLQVDAAQHRAHGTRAAAGVGRLRRSRDRRADQPDHDGGGDPEKGHSTERGRSGHSHTVLRAGVAETGWTGRRTGRRRPAGSSCTCTRVWQSPSFGPMRAGGRNRASTVLTRSGQARTPMATHRDQIAASVLRTCHLD